MVTYQARLLPADEIPMHYVGISGQSPHHTRMTYRGDPRVGPMRCDPPRKPDPQIFADLSVQI